MLRKNVFEFSYLILKPSDEVPGNKPNDYHIYVNYDSQTNSLYDFNNDNENEMSSAVSSAINSRQASQKMIHYGGGAIQFGKPVNGDLNSNIGKRAYLDAPPYMATASGSIERQSSLTIPVFRFNSHFSNIREDEDHI